MTDRLQQMAQWMWEARQRRLPYANLPGGLTPASIADAYAAQELYYRLAEPVYGAVGGAKIATTTKVMQELMGINHACGGAIFARTIHPSPATIPAADFINLRIESEIALKLGADLPASGAPWTRERVAPAVAGAMPAFELIEDRNADYRTLDVRTLIAENSWNGGIVLGPPVAASDPADWDGELQIDSQFVDRGNSRDVLGNPLAAVAWLAGHLAARGQALKPRQWVMTGSIVPTRFAKRDEHYRFSVGSLPPVELRID